MSVDNYHLGPSWIPIWIRKRLPYAREFRVAAKFHDVAYGRGGTVCDKYRADVMFLRLMVARDYSLLGYGFAFFYYSMVRVFGFTSFKYK